MKTITLVTTRFPWPLTNGFANKNYWLIRGLSDSYKIDLHVIQWRRVPKEDMAVIACYCRNIFVYKPTLLDVALGLIVNIFHDRPIQLSLFNSSEAKKNITKCKNSTDIGFVSVLRAMQYLNGFTSPIFCDLADSLSQIYFRDASTFKFMKRMVYREEARRLKKYETHVLKTCQSVFLFNQNEARAYNNPRAVVVPHGVDPKLFSEIDSDDQCNDGVVLFGRMSYEPNVNALTWFVQNVLPVLDKEIKVYVIGADTSSEVIKLANQHPQIILKGFIKNPYPMMRGSIACICPIQIGGGVQNKVIESLAIGAINLVSPLAGQSLENIHESGIIVCREPSDWANKISEIQRSPMSFHQNRELGREYAKKYFSWESYLSKIKEKINNK
jgi:glycosyltransferase involved in cell wall biosynthesis